MKKIFSAILSLILVFCGAVSCGTVPKDSVGIRSLTAGIETLSALKSGRYDVGVLPEPLASVLENTSENVWYRTDLQSLYDEETSTVPQAVLMVKNSVLKTYNQIVDTLKTKISESATWIAQNPADAVSAVKAKTDDGLVSSLNAQTMTDKAILGSKIFWQDAQDAKQEVLTLLNTFISLNPDSANVPSDSFFYNGTVSGEGVEKSTLDFYVPDGAPALSISKPMSDAENFGTEKTVNYHVVAADQIGYKMASGAADFIVMPVNAASKLYSVHGYTMVSVLTHGNLYLLSKKPLDGIGGKTVAVAGADGSFVDFVFKAVLKKAGFNYFVSNE